MFGYGNMNDGTLWRQIHKEYTADRLGYAAELLQTVGVGITGTGVGFQRMIESELGTRQVAEIFELNARLSIEMRSSTPTPVFNELAQRAEAAFQETAEQLGQSVKLKVLLTIILDELDTPWTPGRFGYYTTKSDFHKICLPENLLSRPAELHTALKHEYSHAISAEVAEKSCPTWLDEAIAMAVSDSLSRNDREGFITGQFQWLDPLELDASFDGSFGEPEHAAIIHRAYAQASWIGEYLMSLGGKMSLGRLLESFGDNSFWTELKLHATGGYRADEALHQVYKLNVEQTFERAREYLLSAVS